MRRQSRIYIDDSLTARVQGGPDDPALSPRVQGWQRLAGQRCDMLGRPVPAVGSRGAELSDNVAGALQGIDYIFGETIRGHWPDYSDSHPDTFHLIILGDQRIAIHHLGAGTIKITSVLGDGAAG
jgi:hypothetical protein